MTTSSPSRAVVTAGVIALLSALGGGCCAHRFTKPAEPLADAKPLLSRMQAHSAKVSSFEYLTRMSYYADGEARKGKVEIMGRRAPGTSAPQFHFEALTPTDDTLAVLISNGTLFMSHERGKSVCHTGKACASNVSRLLPIAFAGEDLFAIFSGSAPVILHDEQTAGWDDCEGAYRVVLERKSDATVEEIWLRPDTWAPVRVKVRRAGELLFQIDYSDFEDVDGVSLARRLRLQSPRRDTDLEVQIREAHLNKVTSDKLFDAACPNGTSPQTLRCP